MMKKKSQGPPKEIYGQVLETEEISIFAYREIYWLLFPVKVFESCTLRDIPVGKQRREQDTKNICLLTKM